ncbi:response regulator transcription factor [Arthrobacter sp. H14]|uniref:response regulator transcription factor n=1 Tax=Arthrobacter sp. H14 TaxID=1312959 RepID=UPI00047CB3DE|nr:response regulator [Arthrobacter sp. H14]
MSNAKILVVDDDPDIRDLVALKLSSAGHEILTADDGAEALELATGQHFDAIVLDVMMPGISGIDVVKSLRGSEPAIQTPILLLTARNQERDIEAGFAAGADDYVVKPFSPRELQTRVNVLITRSRY